MTQQGTSDRPFYTTASEYLSKGWSPFYLPAGGKNPPPKNYTGWNGKVVDGRDLTEWLNGIAAPESAPPSVDANIGLRLGVPLADGTCVIGFDIDNYVKKGKPKDGGDQIAQLEEELGNLPATIALTKRYDEWKSNTWGAQILRPDILSGTRLFRVPVGVVLLGNIAADIEVCQFHHRFSVTWPSVADGTQYQIVRCNRELTEPYKIINEIPDALSIPMLPKRWLESDKIVRGVGKRFDGSPESQLKGDELLEWANEHFPKPIADNEIDQIADADVYQGRYGAPMCRRIGRALDKMLKRITEEEVSHDPLNDCHWEILNLGAEGHRGWAEACEVANNRWLEDVGERQKRSQHEAIGEINRSVAGALSKIEPGYTEPSTDGRCCVRLRNSKIVRTHGTAGFDGEDHDSEVADFDVAEHGSAIGNIGMQDVWAEYSIVEYPYTDDGNAKLFVDMYGNNMKYVAGYDQWIFWSDGRWHQDNDGLAERAFRRVIALRRAGAERAREEAVQANNDWILSGGDPQLEERKKQAVKAACAAEAWAKSSGMSNHKLAGVRHARGMVYNGEPVTIDATVIDGNGELLGVANGVLHLTREGSYRATARREDYITRNTQSIYVPYSKHMEIMNDADDSDPVKQWNDYLDLFVPDLEVRRYLQKVLGHGLIGGNPERIIVFLYGTTSTGKSTMLHMINEALGEYSFTDNLRLMKDRDLNPAMAEALPMRIITMSEAGDGRLKADTVKSITGNDEIAVEKKHSNAQIRRSPHFMIVVATNQPPTIPDADVALLRRIVTIPFNERIASEDDKRSASSRLPKVCREVVLAWLVEGWDLYCRESIDDMPEVCQQAKREFESEINEVEDFFASCCDIAPEEVKAAAINNAKERGKKQTRPADWDGYVTPKSVVFTEFKKWYQEQTGRNSDLTQTKFTRSLKEKYPSLIAKINGKDTICFGGIKMKQNVKTTILNFPDLAKTVGGGANLTC